eukprot:scaffold37687_cov51-Attheya_sp.AAC.1
MTSTDMYTVLKSLKLFKLLSSFSQASSSFFKLFQASSSFFKLLSSFFKLFQAFSSFFKLFQESSSVKY